jgi:hypothetical protein
LPISINSNIEKGLVVFKLTTEEVLEEIREELQEIKLLYKELVDRLVPIEEATEDEKNAIKEKDEIADEKELMQTLG